MRKYSVDLLDDDLEPWPFEGAESNYEIILGDPQASGRFDAGSSKDQHRRGIWSCTRGVFSCTELADELQTILRGKVVLTLADGESIFCGPGDSVFTRKGERVTWDIQEDVTKVFFSYNADGDADK